MSYFIYSLKACRLGKKLKNYKDEQFYSLGEAEYSEPRLSLWYRLWLFFWRLCCSPCRICYRLGDSLRNLLFPRDGWLYQFCSNICSDGTFENYVFKTIIGYLGGIILTYIFLLIFVIQLKFTIASSTFWCSVIGVILTLGLAFSSRVRCFVLLLLPLIFSKRGRQGLMAYALILTLQGPGQNIMNNIRILSESLACGQEQLKHALKQILDVIKKPLMAIRDAFRKVVSVVKEIVEKLKGALIVIKRIILTIATVIKTVYQWLKSIVSICNKKLGTPYERCVRVLDDAVVDCQAKLGPLFSWVCSIAYVGKLLCYVAKILDFICIVAHFIKSTVFVFIKQKIMQFVNFIKNIFYVKVKYEREFEMSMTPSKSFREIGAEMVKDVKGYVENCLIFFGLVSLISSLMFLNVIIKVWLYELRYLTVIHFDNKYINDFFVDIDVRRASKNMDTVLPLTRRERHHFVSTKSLRLVTSEKKKVMKTGIFLGLSTLKLSSFIFIDYALCWLMDLVRKYGRFKSTVKAPNMVEVNIVGTGMFASLLKTIVNAFKPLGIRLEIDTTECLPDAVQPDLTKTIQIGVVIALSWIVMFLEPYGMRYRHVVMASYHPVREKERTVWLYNHILHSRTNVLKIIRRHLRKKFVKGSAGVEEETSIKQKLETYFPWLRFLLGMKTPEACMLCAHIVHEKDKEQLVHCHNLSCRGKYCAPCFKEMDNMCTLCMEPLDYGDLSDVSYERDSSEEEFEIYTKKPESFTMMDSEMGLLSEESSELSLSYEYQYTFDTEETDVSLLSRESAGSSRVEIKPVTSSIEIFDEPLPPDYESRRRRTLDLLSEFSDDDISSLSITGYSLEEEETEHELVDLENNRLKDRSLSDIEIATRSVAETLIRQTTHDDEEEEHIPLTELQQSDEVELQYLDDNETEYRSVNVGNKTLRYHRLSKAPMRKKSVAEGSTKRRKKEYIPLTQLQHLDKDEQQYINEGKEQQSYEDEQQHSDEDETEFKFSSTDNKKNKYRKLSDVRLQMKSVAEKFTKRRKKEYIPLTQLEDSDEDLQHTIKDKKQDTDEGEREYFHEEEAKHSHEGKIQHTDDEDKSQHSNEDETEFEFSNAGNKKQKYQKISVQRVSKSTPEMLNKRTSQKKEYIQLKESFHSEEESSSTSDNS